MEGSHSLFGLMWQIAEATGWSLWYIKWGVNYPTLEMMLADQPHYVTPEEQEKEQRTGPNNESSLIAEAERMVADFRTHLKDFKK